MPRTAPGRAWAALVGAAGVGVLTGGVGYAVLAPPGSGSATASPAPSPPVQAAAGAVTGALLPRGSATGVLHLTNPGPSAVRITAIELGPPTTTASGCRTSAVAFALLTVPTPAAPLVVPGRADGRDGSAVVRYTGFMDVAVDLACRHAVLRSDVRVWTDDGPRSFVVGAATVTAGTLR